MYYCGNEYGVGGIGTAVSAPLRLALTGETGGYAKIWDHNRSALYRVALSPTVHSKQTGPLTGGIFQEGITYNTSVFYEQFPVSANGDTEIGRFLAHAIPWYNEFYDYENMMILGRVTSGLGGSIILESAKTMLKDCYPEWAEKIDIFMPDEKARRLGQSVAAAQIPVIRKR